MARAGMLSRVAPRRLSFPPPSAGRSNYTKSEFYVIFPAGAPGGFFGGALSLASAPASGGGWALGAPISFPPGKLHKILIL